MSTFLAAPDLARQLALGLVKVRISIVLRGPLVAVQVEEEECILH